MFGTRSRLLAGGIAFALAVSGSAASLGGESDEGAGPTPQVSTATHFSEFNGSLADLPKLKASKRNRNHPRQAFGGRPAKAAGAGGQAAGEPDGALQGSQPEEGELPTPAPAGSFQGMTQAQTGFRPPDTNGDVGPSHYIQTVNVAFQIFNKAGTSLAGPTTINQLWASAGGLCQANNRGDPSSSTTTSRTAG